MIDKAVQAAQYIFEAAELDEEAKASKQKGDFTIFSEKHMEANKTRAKALKTDQDAAKAMLIMIRGSRLH